ncbi:hypothetical protein FA95DRAFT_1612163 [Auriscalpium vulgare]|uniref:Uncharacterized protein n=1 Tax=Auriscalpium vulgare TaxID=40419 RepID=A0ACB8R764_9AGAM|nr:hypothetical protein FA95DRAFT_1612163 [Auriscalpium vulgare]
MLYRRAWASGTWGLLRELIDTYMLALYIFDLIQALGGVFDVKWIHWSLVHTGLFCTAQGVLQQLGEVGVALVRLFRASTRSLAHITMVGLVSLVIFDVLRALAAAVVSDT